MHIYDYYRKDFGYVRLVVSFDPLDIRPLGRKENEDDRRKCSIAKAHKTKP